MMKKTFTWSVSNGFAVLLLTVGTILAITTLGISFGSPISVDAMVTAAALWLAGVVFLHPAPVRILIPVITLVSLSLGYATYFSTSGSWLLAILATIITAGIISYGFSLRKTIRQHHSHWYD